LGRLILNIEEGNFANLPTSHLKLSILIGMDSFDYMVVDELARIVLFRSYLLNEPISAASQAEFDALMATDAVLSQPFQEQTITTCAAYYTLVPKKLFQPQVVNSYLEQVTARFDHYGVCPDAWSMDEAVNIFGLHHFLEKWTNHHFPKARHTHIISQLVRLGNRHKGAAPNRLYLYLSGHRLAMGLWLDNRLHFSNIFTVYERSQLIYYLGLVFEQFSIEQAQTRVYYLGAFHPDHPLYPTIDRYLAQPVLLGPPQPVQISGALTSMPANLLTLPAVASL